MLLLDKVTAVVHLQPPRRCLLFTTHACAVCEPVVRGCRG